MSYKTVKLFYIHHKNELIVIFILIMVSMSFLFLSGAKKSLTSYDLLEKLAFAILVAIFVRLVDLSFSEAVPKIDMYSATLLDYQIALKSAKKCICINQTWLLEGAVEAEIVAKSNANEIKILLASFKIGPVDIPYNKLDYPSPIYARIASRGIDVSFAQSNVAAAAIPLYKKSKKYVRFCFGHHPGWIAILDNEVFWGPTPLLIDNQSMDVLYRDNKKGERGKFWVDEFDRLWTKFSHDLNIEIKYNPYLEKK